MLRVLELLEGYLMQEERHSDTNTKLKSKWFPQDDPYETLEQVTSGAVNSPAQSFKEKVNFPKHWESFQC